jgi:DNA-binding response OmpR family regulator
MGEFRLKADPKLSPILVVVLTASANASERTTAEQMWVVSYLVKPISAEDLATTIERILRGVAMVQQKSLILVADDNPGLLKLVRRNLELEGYQVITASDGETALQLIKDEEPALAILDIMMPGLDGFQVCEYARQFSEVPIIMLTVKNELKDVVHGLNILADDYMTKPFSSNELLARVKKVLRRAKFSEGLGK